jgi:Na+-transporting NADH:ubiquinone oxidoreductase subunit NqrB
MLKDPAVRRALAVLGIILGLVGSISVLWSVATGQVEWWALIILIPVIAVLRRLKAVAESSR